ncbi:hypothetical protein ACPPVO_28600 [Dactylosporangium sp. McL0621]|uniref:hypothetical protein n=1 Tax=Dactylosporangium sp. McL0621 TaxID=3415678 RepID=UPI003CFAC17D
MLRRTVAVLFATAVLAAGCSEPAVHPDPAAPAPSSAAPVASSIAPGAAPADIVKQADLQAFAFAMPVPKGAPAGGAWTEPLAGDEGNEFVNYLDKSKKGYLTVRLLDCRIPAAQSNNKSYGWCFLTPKGKLKGYPLAVFDDPTSPVRVVTAGHVTVFVDVWVGFDETFKGPDVEAFISSLDLDKLAKL